MRPIDADVMKNYMAEKYVIYDHTFDDIDAQPTIDAVPVVRCKDCKCYNAEGYACINDDGTWHPNDFCSYGERKEE